MNIKKLGVFNRVRRYKEPPEMKEVEIDSSPTASREIATLLAP